MDGRFLTELTDDVQRSVTNCYSLRLRVGALFGRTRFAVTVAMHEKRSWHRQEFFLNVREKSRSSKNGSSSEKTLVFSNSQTVFRLAGFRTKAKRQTDALLTSRITSSFRLIHNGRKTTAIFSEWNCVFIWAWLPVANFVVNGMKIVNISVIKWNRAGFVFMWLLVSCQANIRGMLQEGCQKIDSIPKFSKNNSNRSSVTEEPF